jgi:hypothetical protein
MEKCKLCQQEKPLIKKSHIIPDFLYKCSGIYNEKHQIHKIEIREFLKTKKIKYAPTGEYEGGLLCKECDNELIGNLESYANRVLNGNLSPKEYINCQNYKNSNDGFEYTICENVDYNRFKLFLLSILWRASISSRKIFNDAKLNEVDNENIRLMLINNNGGRINEYPVVTLSYTRDKNVPIDLIIQPIKSVCPDKTLITFLIAGFVYTFYISANYSNLEEINNIAISPNNTLTIMHFPEGEGWNFIFRYLNL